MALREFLFTCFQRLNRLLSGHGWGLGNIPILLAAYRLVYSKLRPSGIALLSIRKHRMYLNTEDRGVAPSLIRFGSYYEEYETSLFESLVEPGAIIVDIGANIGYYTLLAARRAGNSGLVYAFEPEPGNYGLLIKNIRMNSYQNVVAIQKALSNSAGTTQLFTDTINFGNPSFAERNVLKSGGSVNVETIDLDGFLAGQRCLSVDLLKVDAQGAEGLIFDGATRVLEQDKLKIILEFWPFGLRNLGYDPAAFFLKFCDFGLKASRIREDAHTCSPIGREEIVKLCEEFGDADYLNLFLEK